MGLIFRNQLSKGFLRVGKFFQRLDPSILTAFGFLRICYFTCYILIS